MTERGERSGGFFDLGDGQTVPTRGCSQQHSSSNFNYFHVNPCEIDAKSILDIIPREIDRSIMTVKQLLLHPSSEEEDPSILLLLTQQEMELGLMSSRPIQPANDDDDDVEPSTFPTTRRGVNNNIHPCGCSSSSTNNWIMIALIVMMALIVPSSHAAEEEESPNIIAYFTRPIMVLYPFEEHPDMSLYVTAPKAVQAHEPAIPVVRQTTTSEDDNNTDDDKEQQEAEEDIATTTENEHDEDLDEDHERQHESAPPDSVEENDSTQSTRASDETDSSAAETENVSDAVLDDDSVLPKKTSHYLQGDQEDGVIDLDEEMDDETENTSTTTMDDDNDGEEETFDNTTLDEADSSHAGSKEEATTTTDMDSNDEKNKIVEDSNMEEANQASNKTTTPDTNTLDETVSKTEDTPTAPNENQKETATATESAPFCGESIWGKPSGNPPANFDVLALLFQDLISVEYPNAASERLDALLWAQNAAPLLDDELLDGGAGIPESLVDGGGEFVAGGASAGRTNSEYLEEMPSKRSASSEFIEGLDDIDKLFEEVDVPDEFDEGTSIQEIVMGSGRRILVKRVLMGLETAKDWTVAKWRIVKEHAGNISEHSERFHHAKDWTAQRWRVVKARVQTLEARMPHKDEWKQAGQWTWRKTRELAVWTKSMVVRLVEGDEIDVGAGDDEDFDFESISIPGRI